MIVSGMLGLRYHDNALITYLTPLAPQQGIRIDPFSLLLHVMTYQTLFHLFLTQTR